MKLFLFTFTTGIDQMTFLEEHLWETAAAIATGICLTKDRNKNIKCASIATSNQEIISKNIL